MPSTRRSFLKSAALALLGARTARARTRADGPTASTFSVDVTPPLGHPLLGGWRPAARAIRERVTARGIVFWDADEPIVLVAVDWCELRNDAYDRWRDAIAEQVGTRRQRVLVHCVHLHDAPYADLHAQQLLDQAGLQGAMFDRAWFDRVVRRAAEAAAASRAVRAPITHLSVGESTVEQVACNRRVVVDGRVRFSRYSFTRDPAIRDAPEGLIDPRLRSLQFFHGDKLLATLSCYAVHPMSYYGRGEVSYDFVGMAREQVQQDHPEALHIYLTGCAGDVTAAKYNDGTPRGRQQLAARLASAMRQAEQRGRRHALQSVAFRTEPLQLQPRDEGPFGLERAQQILRNERMPARNRIQAALTLSWRKRIAAGQPIELAAVDFGPARFVALPAEMFVGYQLAVQQLCPDQPQIVAAYGECAPGYLPTDQAEREGFVAEHGYAWAAPFPQATIMKAIRRLLAT